MKKFLLKTIAGPGRTEDLNWIEEKIIQGKIYEATLPKYT